MRTCLKACSPHHHPRKWLVVNGTIILWSTILLTSILLANLYKNENNKETTAIELNYLIYNFVTCIIWVIEVFFNVLDYKGYFDTEAEGEASLLQPPIERAEKTKTETAALWIEGILAIYFFIDSTTVAVHLSQEQIHRQAQGMTLDVCVNLAAYSFLVYRQLLNWRESHG